jgi:signal transduction histidine kinase
VLHRLRPTDVLAPAAITAVAVVEILTVRPTGWGYGVVLETGAALLLTWRRYWPLLVTTTAGGMLLLIPWFGPQLDELATPILTLALICYSLGRWIASLRGLVGIALLLVMSLLDYLVIDARSHDFTDVVFVSALAIPPYVFGRITRRLALQSEQLVRQQVLIRDEAVRAERDRIARELHDVIAHSLSAMVVQTAAAQDLVGRIARPSGRAHAVRRRHWPEGARGNRPSPAPDPRRRRRTRSAAHAGSRRGPRPGRDVPRERARN